VSLHRPLREIKAGHGEKVEKETQCSVQIAVGISLIVARFALRAESTSQLS